MAEIKNITGEKLERSHKGNARATWDQILAIGGYGDVDMSAPGGLDLSGLSDAKRAQVNELLEAPREAAARAAAEAAEAEAMKGKSNKKDGK